MGLGKNRVVTLLLIVGAAIWSYSAMVSTTITAAQEKTETVEAGEEAMTEQASDADQSEAASSGSDEQTEPSEQEKEAESEQGSAGEEEEPKEEEPKEEEKAKTERQEDTEKEKDTEENGKEDDPEQKPPKKKRIIGATAKILMLDKSGNRLFSARVDTGAKSCSLHVEEMTIVNEEEGFKKNIGKIVKFKVRNGNEETGWIERRIKKYVLVRTSGNEERRYKVQLTLSWNGGAVEKKVLVTLNDRNGMEYPLLLGRNFLKSDFLVDVDLDNDD